MGWYNHVSYFTPGTPRCREVGSLLGVTELGSGPSSPASELQSFRASELCRPRSHLSRRPGSVRDSSPHTDAASFVLCAPASASSSPLCSHSRTGLQALEQSTGLLTTPCCLQAPFSLISLLTATEIWSHCSSDSIPSGPCHLPSPL